MQNKTFQKTSSALLLLIYVLFHFSCTTETIDNEITDTDSIKNSFTLSNFKDSFIKENLEVNWNDYANIEDDHTLYEFDAYLNNKEDTEDYALGYNIQYKVLATKNTESTWVFEIIKFNIVETEDPNRITIEKLNSFTGTLYEYDLSGEMLRVRAIEAGILIDEMKFTDTLTNTSLQSLSHSITLKTLPQDLDCTGDNPPEGCINGGGDLVENTINSYSDGFSMQGPTVYISTRRTQTRYEYVYSTRGPTVYSIHVSTIYNRTFEGYGIGNNGGEVPLSSRQNSLKDQYLDGVFEYPHTHCSSFEYAKIGSVRGAIVNNVHNLFVALSPDRDVHLIRPNFHRLYLTAPVGVTNGAAANLTAAAFNEAEALTTQWFYANSTANPIQLGEIWYGFLQAEMAARGGTVSRNNLYGFTHQGAEYTFNLFTPGNCK